MQKLESNKLIAGLSSFLITWIFLIPSVFSQTLPAERNVVQAFSQYRSRFIQEKLFVHTDRNSYLSGEICWFRIFYVDAFYNQPLLLSKIAYVEILDAGNHPILQQKVSLKAGESNGSFVIPANILSGNYRLRAYTSWMKNFSADYFFEKTIRLINPGDLKPDSSFSKTKRFDLQFFPEGGNLVQNISSKVAFRITDAYGKGLECEGILLNDKNDTILKFRPAHFGLGNFTFKPDAGVSYKAVIRFPHGEQISGALPVVYPEGITMHVSKTTEDVLDVTLKSSGSMEGENVLLFIHGSHSALPPIETKLANKESVANVKINDLEDGISVFTIFDKQSHPLCERLYFKYPEQNLHISALLSDEYSFRKKIDLSLTTTDQSGKEQTADVSMAVYRIDTLQPMEEMDIQHYLYLNAELGTIEQPAFYFSDSLRDRETHIDDLMLTHGWRRFVWQDLMDQKKPSIPFAPELYGHIIRGKLVNNITGAAVTNITTYLSVPSTRTEFRTTTSGPDGSVKFELPEFYGSQEILLQTNPGDDSVSHVEIQSPFAGKFAVTVLPAFPALSYSPVLQSRSIAEQVQHIYNGDKLNRSVLRDLDSNTFYVEPDEKYLLDNYVRFQTMEEVIREYVVSSNVTMKKTNFQLRLMNKSKHEFFSDPPLMLIDGVPFFDPNEIFRQDPTKINRLDLVNREYALGYQSFPGVINLTTYQGDLNGIQLNARPSVLDYPGIPEQREFFSPVYETEDQVNSRMPDYRTLLYWSPEIKTAAHMKKIISFYTSDLPGKYTIVIMGLTKDGVPGGVTRTFTVKK